MLPERAPARLDPDQDRILQPVNVGVCHAAQALGIVNDEMPVAAGISLQDLEVADPASTGSGRMTARGGASTGCTGLV